MRHFAMDGRRVLCDVAIALFLFSFLLTASPFGTSSAFAQEAEWIWSPEHKKNEVPDGACHFRKAFTVRSPERGQITIAADDSYELFLNGTRIGAGESARNLDRYDISSHLRNGRNLVAVKVNNSEGKTAALVARVQIKERSSGWSNFSTDDSWKTSLRPLPLWNLAVYNDRGWVAAQSFGMLGSTEPWDRAQDVATNQQQSHKRFRIASEFQVDRLINHESCGSLIAMTFNEFGQILASQEDGPLVLITDSNRDSVPDRVQVYCDKIKRAQGILALNGDVYVTADGPDGNALYKLIDKDRDGKADTVETIFKFKGPPGEHGPHGLTLGPDGMIYIAVGNHSGFDGTYDELSPHKNFYEGDLLPKYEDPGGHALGIKAPGGAIIRTDLKGEKVELVAGGLRNTYDLAFNEHGDLFTHDSDMESDIGMSWYRPTQVFQVIPGGEYGWRSGWSKWPDFYVDALPAMVDSGRGSPTGAVVYNHLMFPKRFHGALFLGDWSEGRIIVVMMKRTGGAYQVNSEVFIEGQPLNVTDLDVGPDGSLYFITGGRGTSGGVYRVTWRGKVPESISDLGEGITHVIRQTQFQSAWARQQVAGLKIKVGDEWNRSLVGVAMTAANPSHYRTRALDVMQLFGPSPTEKTLVALAKDKNEDVRAKAAELMGLHPTDGNHKVLIELLQDSDRIVRRKACEALVRANQTAPVARFQSLLTSDSQLESIAARRLLERLPTDQWSELVLTTGDHRLFIQGAVALMVAEPTKKNGLDVISRISALLEGFVSDRNFVDMLRVAQIAIHRGKIQSDELPTFRLQIAEEFPSGNSRMNRELSRLLAYLQVGEITDRYITYLQTPDAPDVDKVHVAMHLRFIKEGWTSEQRLEMLRYFSKAIELEGGGSYEHYVMNASRDFAKSIDEKDVMVVLANGAQWPHAALGALYKLPKDIDQQTLQFLKQLDYQLADRDSDGAKQLKVGIVAVLARSGDEASMEHLRDVWLNDPERRETVAMGLAQQPDGANWDYLLRSLPVLEENSAKEVMKQLTTVNVRPEEGEYYRQVILKGLLLKDKGSEFSIKLLEHWNSQKLSKEDDDWETALAAWQNWYREKFPSAAEPVLPVTSDDSKWDFDELLEYVSGKDGASATADKGALAFEKAQCIKCHRFGGRGESMGPDLSTLNKRFTRKEVLQSILFPSHVISDQYAAKTIITTKGKQYTGIVAPGAGGETVVLGIDGKKIAVPNSEIDEIVVSKTSAMPPNLLDPLTLEEIADLFAYLGVAPPPELARRPDEKKPK